MTGLVVTLWCQPVEAWGYWMHALVAERSMAVLLPRHPELMANQEAWWLAAWSASFCELNAARRRGLAIREPNVTTTQTATPYLRTFAHAWSIHHRLDQDFKRFAAGQPMLDARDERRNDLLIGLLGDAQLSATAHDVALKQSRIVSRAIFGPEGHAWATWFGRLIDVDVTILQQAARLECWMLSQGVDASLNRRARSLGSDHDATWLRGPAARQSTGDLLPVVVALSNDAVATYQAMVAPSSPSRPSAANTAPAAQGKVPPTP